MYVCVCVHILREERDREHVADLLRKQEEEEQQLKER